MMIHIKVKPNSSEQSIEKIEEVYVVKLKSPPEEGKANLELIKILTKYFGFEVKIKSGFKSRHKIVQVFN